MSLLDFDDFTGAVAEIGRVLRSGGQVCLAVVHPFISAQDEDTLRTASFRVSGPYLRARRYTAALSRVGARHPAGQDPKANLDTMRWQVWPGSPRPAVPGYGSPPRA